MKKVYIVLIVSALVFLIVLLNTAFVVTEIEQVVITRFGKIKKVYTEPGLNFMLPFVETKHVYPKRIIMVDKAPNKIPTADKKYLVVDNYSKWKIVDPVKFKNTMITIPAAAQRLDDLIFSTIREDLGTRNLSDIIAKTRDSIMHIVTLESAQKAVEFGIEIVDVRIKRADLPKENEEAVFKRMRAERRKEANQYRSEGDEDSLKIIAHADKEKAIILAGAYEKARIIEGEADGEATQIYARAFTRDPDFYNFVKAMEAYETIIDTSTVLVIPNDSKLMRHFYK